MAQDFAVQPLFVVAQRHAVDAVDVQRLDHRALIEVAEQRDFGALVFRDLAVGAAEQNIRVNAHGLQFFDRVLGWLGLQLTGCRDEGHQRQMQEQGAFAAELVAQLADGFEEGGAFDIADRAANLADHEVLAVEIGKREILDGVGDVRDDLHGCAEVFALPLLGEDVGVDPAGRHVVRLQRRHPGEAFVVSQIEVGLSPVVGHVDLAVLVGAHGARIDVEIRVEFAQADAKSARLQQGGKRRTRQAFAQRGDHATGYEDIPCHGRFLCA